MELSSNAPHNVNIQNIGKVNDASFGEIFRGIIFHLLWIHIETTLSLHWGLQESELYSP